MNKMMNSNRRALVTGATGYIGSNLVKRLVEQKWKVHVVARPNSGLDALNSVSPSIVIHRYDGTGRSMIDIVRQAQPDIVFHLASLFLAQHKSEDIDNIVKSNILFSTQLVEAMATCGNKFLINVGTSWQHYQNFDYKPVNLYASTKQAFEDILAYYTDVHDMRVITLVLFDTYGPDDPRSKLVSLLWNTALSQEPLSMSPGEQLIDLVHINDVLDAFSLSADLIVEQDEGHIRYGISSGNPMRLIDLVAIFEEAVGIKLPITWGGRSYRPREVMLPWKNYCTLPGWKPRVVFRDGIKQARPVNRQS